MTKIYNLLDTWNDSGVAWRGIQLDVTNTASSGDSRLIDLKTNGVSKFSIDASGNVYSPSLKTNIRITATDTLSGIYYFNGEKPDGSWKVNKFTSLGIKSYADIVNNSGVLTSGDAWSSRYTLNYS